MSEVGDKLKKVEPSPYAVRLGLTKITIRNTNPTNGNMTRKTGGSTENWGTEIEQPPEIPTGCLPPYVLP
jgi:hypothetical protein